MSERWFKEAVIYCLDVETFQDSNGDGVGDFGGLIQRLDYLDRLGVTCLWLNPIHPSPNRDDGYDVTDYYNVDPALGTLGDFVELMHQASNRGLRVIIDLVVNHTSDQHPWFQAARSDPASPYRDWYIWSPTEPTDARQGVVFPGDQATTWTYDDEAEAWYYHRFYDFQPDLNIANPDVREEIKKILGFWLQLGVSGFRMDAAPFVIELTHPNEPEAEHRFEILEELRDRLSWRRGDATILAEANVARDEVVQYFGDGNRLPMLFNFLLNQRTFLALARSDPAPLVGALEASPAIPDSCTWATFLRNHDEVDLGRLGDKERDEVFAAFGPEESMQLYGRGIRRRLAPMLGNDHLRIRMAYALQATLPGTPVIRYGEEIGMGDDLSLPERNAIRTPMQWSSAKNAGFSTAPAKKLCRPVVNDGEFGFENVNVVAQRRDPDSLLSWMERMFRTLRECPEFGTGRCTALDVGRDSTVLALRFDAPTGVVVAFTNLADEPCTVDVSHIDDRDEPLDIFADDEYELTSPGFEAIDLNGYGFRWIRLR
ncbi:MAG TPA: alpha-amylase family protein [Acidimicrobiales bacterium]|nr:alpha-amylase family protein [Acidimicrobiales bacterium]